MAVPDASKAGRFKIGGDVAVNRLGFGAMRITGKGIWGPPVDRTEALRTLRRLPDTGIDFIDTADSYGPHVSEELIAEAFPAGKGMFIATKAGLTRPGPDQWRPDGRPEYLIRSAKESARRLGLDQIPLWQLHRIDPTVPRDEQFGAVAQLLNEGHIRFAGLSEVSIDDIEAASEFFPVATVQNRYNLADRESEEVLDYCQFHGIGFIPWYPLAAGALTNPGSSLDRIAKSHGATQGQIALAWLLKRSRVMLPIPGTSKVAHLDENVGAAAIELSSEDIAELGSSDA